MPFQKLKFAAVAAAVIGAVVAMPAQAGKTLDAIKARGQIICGVHTGLPGFSAADSNGKWVGLDVDICRAVAAATLGDAGKVKYVPLTAQARFTALQSGEVDMLSRNTTFTLTRDASLGLSQTAVVYYDGQGFMVPVKSKITSAKQLKGQTVCVQSGTTTEKNLTDYSSRCLAYTTDASGLAAVRNKVAPKPDDHLILPELISKEPLGPLVRRGDDEWAAIVKWTIYGLLEAEENGITQANVDELKSSSKDPVVGRILGSTEDTGKLLGLDREWMLHAVKATGNYGEIFERNVGMKSALQLPRGLNNLWNNDGIQYAPPIR